MTTPAPIDACLQALKRVRDEIDDLDALAGNLSTLLEGLPGLDELAAEREPEDIERIARQARLVHRSVAFLRAELDEVTARLIAATTPPPN